MLTFEIVGYRENNGSYFMDFLFDGKKGVVEMFRYLDGAHIEVKWDKYRMRTNTATRMYETDFPFAGEICILNARLMERFGMLFPNLYE